MPDPIEEAAAGFERRHGGLALAPVAVVVPAYNEAASVGAVVRSVPATMAGLPTAVLVVDDGSTDGTAAVAEEAGALVCSLPRNQGQGAALRAGYRIAVGHGARIVATLDADGQWDAADLPALVAEVAAGRADLVSGSRRLGSDADRSPVRSTGVVVFAAVIRALTRARVTDPANGLRAMTAEVAGGVTLDQPQFQSAELLLTAICRGYRVSEVPVGHHPRLAGTTKKGRSLSYGLRFGRALLATYVRERGWRRLAHAG